MFAGMTDIFERIRADHDKHRTLLDIIERTHGDSRGRQELFPKLADEVRAHAHAEERTLYAELLGERESRDDAGHSVKQHHEVEAIIEELLEKDYSGTGWLARFRTLAEKLRQHMVQEEKEFLAVASRVLSDERKGELIAEFEGAKGDAERQVA